MIEWLDSTKTERPANLIKKVAIQHLNYIAQT